MILLDSNIVIGYLNGDVSIIERLDAFVRERRALFISLISVSEALCLPEAGDNLATIEQFIDGFIVIEPDKEIAKVAAALRRTHRLDIPDAYIVATAITRNVPLATRDKKMRSIPGLVLADI